MSDNPYQAPAVQEIVAPAAPSTEAETIRNHHLKHEASIKAIGFLHFLSAVLVAFSLVGLFVTFSSRSASPTGGREVLVIGMLVMVSVAQFIAGWGLRKLRPWAKIPAAILAGLSLLSIPVGTLIGAYILYLLFSAKGRTVLSPAYGEIVAQTPHLRYRTPRWIWITLLVIVLLILGIALFGTKIR